MYKLRHSNAAVAAVWDSLPTDAREELDLALFDTIEDPYGATQPVNGDNPADVERTLTLRFTSVTLLIIDAPPIRRVYLRTIDLIG
ncbi:hypothetical protein ABZ686_11665 [Streptomyces sp. NPDC006992]|uniref:hypothetical protein n=1 Tax=unclassified Streptomyces TaxID=2593676 RepID=UPI0033E37F2F